MKKFKFYHWLIIAFIGMITAGLGIGYAIDRSKNKGIQNTQTQITSPRVETPKTEEKKDEPKIEESVRKEVKNEPTAETPVNEEAVAEPQITPPSATKPTCDEAKKLALTTQYNTDIAQAVQKRDQLLSDANAEYASAGDRAREEYKDIFDPFARERLVAQAISLANTILVDARNSANMDYNGTETYLTLMYNAELQGIYCSN